MAVIAKRSLSATALIPVACHVLLPSGDMTLVSSMISGSVPKSDGVTIDLGNTIHAASWISVAILPLCIFLLVSYAVLPAKWTHRHYLSICFTLGICCMEASWMLACAADLYS